ncbi:T6SS effector phospholipase Tle3 domain-containing protein [Janthinobacterium aquaticum]|uniref:T6SS effector phospholipase Tle3 domain-containing protein n=1 Tax=Janthinobacterium sp. FT58W TaxID=2654254 RepID=UPI00126556BE|nr:hypothetical protein [Janthinobacterium sp. FT58W]KAB8045060.1 hypothetical protein GCM43_01085 [Janthinobacterium sp. FT58W]
MQTPEFPGPDCVLLAEVEGVTRFDKGLLDAVVRLPRPGIMIFVHGVNSDGEWYDEAEQGLCAGLNARLKRRDQDLHISGPASGQMQPARYARELTEDGFLNPRRNATNFLQADHANSPVIRFRWGYKASGEELQQFGDGIYLNEKNYWGGGPFANGCSALPDLWSDGLSEELFLWMHIQHMNPTNDRQVYACPPRAYFVFAAWRLARLVQSIRACQHDAPVTIVCHSQGNMVAMAAAFLGDRLGPSAVADSYVLCNPPYSLLDSNFTENWISGNLKDPHGNTGRQKYTARAQTLKAFFAILHTRQGTQQDSALVDQLCANLKPERKDSYTAVADREDYGLNGFVHGRVTLYFNPHDQVISATPIQGIGWRGMSAQEIADTGGEGVFTQRVFAQNHLVGQAGEKDFDIWQRDGKPLAPDSHQFWSPPSKIAVYSIEKGLRASRSIGSKILTFLLAPIAIIATSLARTRINALPPEHWKLPMNAPALPEPFLPEAKRYGEVSLAFDEGFDMPAEALDAQRADADGDAYAGHRSKGRGNADSEASLKYEMNGMLRMQARREKLVEPGQPVTQIDQPETATTSFNTWRNKEIRHYLGANIDTYATDHSTILTCAGNAEKALAYDVAVGVCTISNEQLQTLRIAADWRILAGLPDENEHKQFKEYFADGKYIGLLLSVWVNNEKCAAKMPEKIMDERQNQRPQVNYSDLILRTDGA